MRYFLICFLFPFFASSQVVIPEEVARFYLERHEQVKILEQENVILKELIVNLEKEVSINQSIIGTYQVDQESYGVVITTLRKQVALNENLVKDLNREIDRRKKLEKIFGGVAILVIILTSVL